MIESVNNEKVKYWAKLKDKKYRDESGEFLIETEHIVQEAEKAGFLKEVIVLDGYEYSYENATRVSEPVMKKIMSLTTVPSIIGIAKKLESREIKGNVVILDGIQDPGNMGTIIRSAVAFGIDSIVIGPGCVDIYNPKVIRSTEGLLFHVNLVIKDTTLVIEELHEQGYKVYATKVDGGSVLKDTKFTNKTAIVLGSEGRGVTAQIMDMCDEFLYIPMDERCESLNVGVAASIILYELAK